VITVAADGATLCAEALGDADPPTLLLIGGGGWSMDWWDDALCLRLTDRGRRVVRYDQRDTGASTRYPPGAPGYGPRDLVDDAVAVLDAVGVARAHVVGLSMGGGVAQWLARAHADRVATLTVLSSSPIDRVGPDLPGPGSAVRTMFTDPPPRPDWSDRDAVIEYVVEGERPYAGPGMFDEARVRAIAARVVDRTPDMAASLTNHGLITGGGNPPGPPSDPVLMLVLHGTADPLFPVEHGRALAASVPGARLIELPGVGHQLPPPATWDTVVDALVAHTGG
jgi:pimeloyl-ACP methyl ester carboxylesterase